VKYRIASGRNLQLGEISPELTIIIADYGLGSDTVVASIIEPIATTPRLFACHGGNAGTVKPGSLVPKPSTNLQKWLGWSLRGHC